jgi:hypothetical protein
MANKNNSKVIKKEPVETPVQQVGWKCPVCGAGNSPWNMTCPCSTSRFPNPWKAPDPYPWRKPYTDPSPYPYGDQPWLDRPYITWCSDNGPNRDYRYRQING